MVRVELEIWFFLVEIYVRGIKFNTGELLSMWRDDKGRGKNKKFNRWRRIRSVRILGKVVEGGVILKRGVGGGFSNGVIFEWRFEGYEGLVVWTLGEGSIGTVNVKFLR